MARFVDTNILVYAEDLDAGEKRAKPGAQGILCHGDPQAPSTDDSPEGRHIVGQYLTWRVIASDPDLLRSGIRRSRSSLISLGDALLVEAALRGDCDRLYSEDLNHGQRFGRLEIINPLLP